MPRRMILPLLFGLIGAAILVWLGAWQVSRLQWKLGQIATAEARIAEAPVALPATPDPVTDRYRAVRVEGRFLGPETYVLTSIQGEGPGFLVIAAYETSEGRRIMVDRGFVLEADKTALRPPHQAAITGNLIWPDDVNSSTPPYDAKWQIWFGRDVPGMAALLGAEPLLVVARDPTGDGVRPQPVTATFRNDHLGYAITWFSLAVVWLGMTVFYLWRIRQRNA